MGVRAFGHVSEVEPGDWYRVDERGQDPGQELDCRELLQSMKQVAEGHQANGYADDQEIQEQGQSHCNSGTNLS